MNKIGTGERLRLIRGYQSSAAFAVSLGVSDDVYRRFESEESSPDLDFLIRLKFATGCSLDWLASGQDSDHIPSIDTEILADVIRSVEGEAAGLDCSSRANLIARLYRDFRRAGGNFTKSTMRNG